MTTDPFLLHMFNPTKNVSPFDVNMAYEADFNGVIPYTNVELDDIHTLTQDTIFSRGPKGVKRTGIFIGGRDFALAIDMLKRAKAAMVPPFEVSVFADPSGAITTAAAIVASIERWVDLQNKGDLSDKNLAIIGTGPVAVCAGILASQCGARVSLVSYLGPKVAQQIADQYNRQFDVDMKGAGSQTETEVDAFMGDTHIVLGAAKAGIRVLRSDQLAKANQLIVAADVNAVPPLGIEGIDVNDMGKVLEATPSNAVGIGALAIGDIKYKVHFKLFKMMLDEQRESPLYVDHEEAFKVARVIAKEKINRS